MTPEKESRLSTWAPTIVAIITNLLLLGIWGGYMQSKLETVAQALVDHAQDKEVHMPSSEKIETFVLRPEWTSYNTLEAKRTDDRHDSLKENIQSNETGIIKANEKLDRLTELILKRLP